MNSLRLTFLLTALTSKNAFLSQHNLQNTNDLIVSNDGKSNDNSFNRIEQVNPNLVDSTSFNGQNVALNSYQDNGVNQLSGAASSNSLNSTVDPHQVNVVNQLSTTTLSSGLNSVVNSTQGNNLNPSIPNAPVFQNLPNPSISSNPVQHLWFNHVEQTKFDSVVLMSSKSQNLVTPSQTILNPSGTALPSDQNLAVSIKANEPIPLNSTLPSMDNKPISQSQEKGNTPQDNNVPNHKSLLDWLKELAQPKIEQKRFFDDEGVNYPWKTFGKITKKPFKLPFKNVFGDKDSGKKDKKNKADPNLDNGMSENGVPNVVPVPPNGKPKGSLKGSFRDKFKNTFGKIKNPFARRGTKSSSDSAGITKKSPFMNPFGKIKNPFGKVKNSFGGRGSGNNNEDSEGKIKKSKFKNPFKNPFKKPKKSRDELANSAEYRF